MAIDKDAIVNDTLGGVNRKADGIIPPAVFGFRDKVKAVPYDVAAAKKLLAEAGYPEGKGLPKFEMSYRNNRPDIRLVAEAVGAQWDKNLGIKTTFRAPGVGDLPRHPQQEDPAALPHALGRRLPRRGELPQHPPRELRQREQDQLREPAFDALCRKADTSSDPEERKRLYAEAEDMVVADAPFIPIYFQRDAELVRPTVKGMRDSVFGHLPHVKVVVGG